MNPQIHISVEPPPPSFEPPPVVAHDDIEDDQLELLQALVPKNITTNSQETVAPQQDAAPEEVPYFSETTVDNSSLSDIARDEESARGLLKEQRLNDIKNQCSCLINELAYSTQNPKAIVKRHIIQLEKYHELKDIALGLITMIADQRKLKTLDILEEMKLEVNE